MINKKQNSRNKLGLALIVIGLSLCLQCLTYGLLTGVCNQIVEMLKLTRTRAYVIGEIVAVSDGIVTYAEDATTIICYYNEWDGAEYKTVISHINPRYSEKTKLAVVYGIGMGPGSCIVTGFYMERFLICGIVGFILLMIGMILKLKGKEKWQEERLLRATGR